MSEPTQEKKALQRAEATLSEVDRPANALSFQFNPTTVSFTRPVQYNRTKKQASDPPVQFTGAGPTTLTLQILLDAKRRSTPAESVQKELDLLSSWTTVPDVKKPGKGPPLVGFTWGELKFGGLNSLVGNISSLKITVEMFEIDGKPLRALVDLTLVSAHEEPAGTNPTSGAERSRIRHVLRRGETLQSVAWSRLDDVGAWRAIAELNGIDDPTRLTVGRELLLPDEHEHGALGMRQGPSGVPPWLADGSRS